MSDAAEDGGAFEEKASAEGAAAEEAQKEAAGDGGSLWQCFVGELALSERAAEERRMERLVDNMPGFVRVLVYVEKVRRRKGERDTERGRTVSRFLALSLFLSLSLPVVLRP